MHDMVENIKIDEGAVYIACCSDENFVMPLAVMLKSLFVNLAKERKVIVYFLDAGITSYSKDRLLRSIDPFQSNLQFIRVNKGMLPRIEVQECFGAASFYRLLVPYLLPVSLKKAIYLDADLIVNANIGELWDIKIEDNYILAVQEQGEKGLYLFSSLLNYKELGLDPMLKYFNSGVLVINLDKWREEDFPQKIFKYIEQNRQFVVWIDQDALNALLAHKWGELDHRWNLLTQTFDNSSWERGPIKERDVYERLIHHPYIIHFNTPEKPWQANNRHPYRNLFFHYLDMTEWRGWRP